MSGAWTGRTGAVSLVPLVAGVNDSQNVGCLWTDWRRLTAINCPYCVPTGGCHVLVLTAWRDLALTSRGSLPD